MNNILINNSHSFSYYASSFFNESMLPVLSEIGEKVAIVVLIPFTCLAACYRLYRTRQEQFSHSIDLESNQGRAMTESSLHPWEKISYPDDRTLEVGFKADEMHRKKSKNDQKTTNYLNSKTLYLENISDIPKEKFLVIKNYAYHIDELVSHIVSKSGIFIDPYRMCMFDNEDINKILSFKEARPILEINKKKDCSFIKIPKSAGNQLKKLAKAMSKDYNPENGYQISKEGIEHFQTYFSTLSPEEQEALESAIITYKDTSIKPPIIVRSTFKEVFTALAVGEFCNHQAAVYFWVLGMKIDPSSEQMPEKIKFTSRYWNNLLIGEDQKYA